MALAGASTEGKGLALDVESKLVAHYLSTTGAYGSASLTHIDATGLEIADCLGMSDPQQAILCVRDACGSEVDVSDFLAYGTFPGGMPPDLPGYFRFLVLTCIVVASADENVKTQEFGKNLQRLLDTTRSFGNRQALPVMWHRLEKWAQQRRRKGAEVRRISLPKADPRVPYLGLTNAMSFPSWRDTHQLRSLFDKASAKSRIESPRDAALIVCPQIRSSLRFSLQMRAACDEFAALHTARASLLKTHRFWVAVLRALELKRPRTQSVDGAFRAELALGAVSEDTRIIFLREQDSAHGRDGTMLTSPVSEALATLEILCSEFGDRADDLLSALRKGAVPFVREGYGVWLSSFSGGDADDHWIYLVRQDRVAAVERLAFVKLRRLTNDWLLIESVDRSAALHIHHALDLHRGHSQVHEMLFRLRGGIRTIAGYLGRSRLLPWIELEGSADVSLSSGDDSVHVAIERGKDEARLSHDHKLDGPFILTLEDRLGDRRMLSAERTIRFVADAPEHATLRRPSTSWKDRLECCDEALVEGALEVCSDPPILRQLDRRLQSSFDDLLELVYARGQMGWAENELIEVIKALAPGPSPWEILRTLQESGWLQAKASVRWRANLWCLTPPTLRRLSFDGSDATALFGSTSTSIRARFEATAVALGGTVHTIQGIGSYSPITLVATGVCESLSSELGLPIRDALVAAAIREPQWWHRAPVGIEQHGLHREWSWIAGEFRSIESDFSGEDVEVRWWRRQENDRADLFSVDGGAPVQFVSPSRAVALSEAFRRSRRPMFVLRDGALRRLPKEGHLPLHLAQTMHASSLVAPGVILVDGRWRYSYPASQLGIASVRACLGRHFIQNDTPQAERFTSKNAALIGLARHRGGRSIRYLVP